MPKFGQMVEESTIVKWRMKEGDSIKRGDVLFEIETDKATMEVESFLDGTLLKIIAKEGDTVPVQTPVAFMGNPGDIIPDVKISPKATPAAKEARTSAPVSTQRAAMEPAPMAGSPAPAPVQQAAQAPAMFRISPRAKKLASKKVIDPAAIKGTGPEGRIVEKDVLAYLDAAGYDKLRISPAAKTLAAKNGIDILRVHGTGDCGRIMAGDVERAIAEKPAPMSKMRQVIAQRLTQSFTSTPHFYTTVEVDMTDLLAFRMRLKEEGHPYTVTDFIMQALIATLSEFKDVNSTTDGKSIWWHSKVHLGLAVSLEKGLVVPVIRDADDLSVRELHDRAADLAARARDGKLAPDEMSGSTFTLSNMGMLNVENFGAIINPGEGAILAVATTMKKPAVKDDRIVIRSLMKLTLSADHRLIDGAVGARFVNAIKTKLEDIESWKRLI